MEAGKGRKRRRYSNCCTRPPHGRQRQVAVWNIETVEWVPAVFIVFKVSVLGIAKFRAIKWH